MSKRKKKEKEPIEMNTQELAEHIFGKELKGKLDQIVREQDSKPSKRSSQE